MYRIAGFNDRGEAKIVNEHGKLVAWAELRIDAMVDPDKGDLFDVDVKITWTPEQGDEQGGIDWEDWANL